MTETTNAASVEKRGVAEVVAQALEVCRSLGRDDLVDRLRAAEVRLRRPTALVCVMGEYKQGKSMLVNALAGTDLCPVDDDAATTAFVSVTEGTTTSVRVRRSVDGRATIENIAPDEVWRVASERGPRDERAGVELVEIDVATGVLPAGIVLLDTPGVGGLLDRRAASTLRYLRLADAVLFVTDTSQELSRSEVDFLHRARSACPTLFVIETKTDLYPAADRLVELDRRHLADAGMPLEPIAVSAATYREARRRDSVELEAESGIRGLRDVLREDVVADADGRAARHATDEAVWALERLRQPLAAEVALAADPERVTDAVAALQHAEGRLRTLQAAGARWATALNDGVTDLRTDVDHRLRAGTRSILTELDVRLEESDPGDSWDELVDWVQDAMATVVDELFAEIDHRAAAMNEQIARLLEDDVAIDIGVEGGTAPAIDQLWGSSDRTLKERRSGFVQTGLTALRGGSSGTIVLGMVARFAGIAMATPASIGIAVVFGAKQVVDARKQEVGRRRQEARTVVRRFVDEATLEVGTSARRLVQDAHRALRDAYSARLEELTRSATDAMASAQAVARADAEARRERATRAARWVEHIDSLLDRLLERTAP